jgi:hypothetical protein
MRAFYETDLTDVLPVIRVPTLVLYRGEASGGHARDVSERVRDAHLVQIPGDDLWGIFLSPEIPNEIERFVASQPAAEETERVLTTMLFTDLVGSSARAAAVGDNEWKRLLERHHRIVRQELAHYRGREVDTAGDGFFSTFDGPARSDAQLPSAAHSPSSTFVQACIQASARCWLTSPPAWQFTQARGSALQRAPARYSSPTPSRTWSPDQVSRLTTVESTGFGGFRTHGTSTRSSTRSHALLKTPVACLGQCCSYVKAGLALRVLKTTRASWRLRQRSAFAAALPLGLFALEVGARRRVHPCLRDGDPV